MPPVDFMDYGGTKVTNFSLRYRNLFLIGDESCRCCSLMRLQTVNAMGSQVCFHCSISTCVTVRFKSYKVVGGKLGVLLQVQHQSVQCPEPFLQYLHSVYVTRKSISS